VVKTLQLVRHEVPEQAACLSFGCMSVLLSLKFCPRCEWDFTFSYSESWRPKVIHCWIVPRTYWLFFL